MNLGRFNVVQVVDWFEDDFSKNSKTIQPLN